MHVALRTTGYCIFGVERKRGRVDPCSRVEIHLPNANVVCLLDGLMLIGWKMQWVKVKLRTMPDLWQGPWETEVNSRVLSGLLPMTGS